MPTTEKELFRATPARGAEKIDAKNGVIYGFAVIEKGEVRTHDVEADDTTLDQVVKLGRRLKLGVKSRFGHQDMSSEALGTFIGRAKGFRRDGDVVRADLHLDDSAYKTPNGDLAGYILELAENDPDAFGASIVFDGTREHRINEDGTPQKGEDGEELLPLVRVKKLFAVDAVDDPAATSGFFDTGGGRFFTPDVELSAKARVFLGKLLDSDDGAEKIEKFFARLGYVKQKEDPMPKEPTDEKTYAEGYADGRSKGQKDAEAQFKADHAEALSKAREEGMEAERKRIAQIQEAALPGQEELAQKAIKEGLSVEAAQASFLKDGKEKLSAQADALKKDEVPGLGSGDAPEAEKDDEKNEPDPLSDEGLKKQWAALGKSERSEFGNDFEDYKAFKRNEKNVHIRTG